MDSFILNGLLAGIGVAIVGGPLGCFVVWRRLAYFGDSLAHSALFGIALGFLLGIDLTLGIALTCVVFAVAIVFLQEQNKLASDTLLGILSHTALSLGLVVIAFLQTVQIDLLAYLFGDVLAVRDNDLILIYGGAILVLTTLLWIWRSLIALTMHEELARAEGVPVFRVRLIFTLLLAVTIAIGMKIIGILLITSLLIIPAAAARRFARTPEQMAVIASIIGALSVLTGLLGSVQFDTPSGPSVVVAAFCFFLLSTISRRRNVRAN
ncbi:MAG TPA: zinc ABC transporter permease subunit ZnuB [Rhodospirillaceae bacterium]|nr:zinc ABC transporter permease [Rhodospirillaceae bacterium]HAA92822.1 zinc ABC transporter permease subunit ZnuB [Rhodospirillaceae bacterium]HAT34850.1 zinc ABC transporter permease subunit ZnuB [Rhodospirillaceae bacterium]